MILSDFDISNEISAGRIVLYPSDLSGIQPASLDVRVDRRFRVFTSKYPYIDPSLHQPEMTEEIEVAEESPFVLRPGQFALASTYETVRLPDDIAARLEGKSSLGRLGLLVHSTAGFIDPGFSGNITLELSNVSPLPIRIWPGSWIGQLCFMRMSSPVDAPYGHALYGSRYQGQSGPTPSRSYEGFERF